MGWNGLGIAAPMGTGGGPKTPPEIRHGRQRTIGEWKRAGQKGSTNDDDARQGTNSLRAVCYPAVGTLGNGCGLHCHLTRAPIPPPCGLETKIMSQEPTAGLVLESRRCRPQGPRHCFCLVGALGKAEGGKKKRRVARSAAPKTPSRPAGAPMSNTMVVAAPCWSLTL
jgi:hypothetical protein